MAKHRIAITRAVSRNLANCELTHFERQPIDVALARRQHEAYEAALLDLGFVVESQPPLDDLPDSVFVEDTALVLDEIAVIARMGARSRQSETPHTMRILAGYRRLAFIDAPGTLEGGDIVRIGKRIFVGLSSRTNKEGVSQLHKVLTPYGYTVTGIEVKGALHLKSVVSALGPETIIVNPDLVDATEFHAARVLHVHREEPWGANVLDAGQALLVSSSFPRTKELLESSGFATHPVNVSELHKAESGVTCMSLLFRG